MLSKIYNDFFSFVDLHDTEKKGLIDQWYRENFLNLACALKNSEGLKLLINIESLSDFENYCKKLFLFSDIIVIRDIQKRTDSEFELISIPVSPRYTKTYSELKDKKIPPLLIAPQPDGFWTSSTLKLKDGFDVPLAVKFRSYFPSQSYNWMIEKGKYYMETGQIVYAPFIPPIEVELEFLKQGVNMPSMYDTQSFFYKDYDWLDNKSLTSLLLLNLPTLENIDITILNKIKADHYDSFKLFRNDLLDSISQIKGKIGDVDFIREVKYIQRNKIDDNIDKLNLKLKKIEKMRTLRGLGATIGLAGINIVANLGLSLDVPITGLTSALTGMVTEFIIRMKENSDLEENPSYFIWKLNNVCKK